MDQIVSAKDPSDATLTVRVIKSFEYRTIKNLVYHHLNLNEETVGELLQRIKKSVASEPGFKPFRLVDLDTIKIYTHAHLTKPVTLAINLDRPEWVLESMHKTLAECGIMNESEVSCFNREMYELFKVDPVEKW